MEYTIGLSITTSIIGFILGKWYKKLGMEEDVLKTNKETREFIKKTEARISSYISDSQIEQEKIQDIGESSVAMISSINQNIKELKEIRKGKLQAKIIQENNLDDELSIITKKTPKND